MMYEEKGEKTTQQRSQNVKRAQEGVKIAQNVEVERTSDPSRYSTSRSGKSDPGTALTHFISAMQCLSNHCQLPLPADPFQFEVPQSRQAMAD